ncbi:MAG TPA: beta-ketoacyl-ACP synthase II [Acidimicrobiales bacterium]|jgi:3-oxoacyl-[acyl-carrier-protein] synthase II|nr:beta-ketoacyl-ACP synthase II [Acidimicrobiales bacterium]
MQSRRVAVTGVGVLAACGIGRDDFWSGLLAPQPTDERRINGFDPSTVFENPKEIKRTDRVVHLALAAAQEAMAQAGQFEVDPDRAGVLFGTGVGGLETLEAQVIVRVEKGERRVSPFLVPMMMANSSSAALSMKYGYRGPCETIATACAASTHAIGNAARLIATGRCDAMMTGGAEASMTITSLAGFANMTALSTTGVSRPFDAERDGFIMSEGAAVLILEEWSAAEARGATILAEVLGSASNADAHHITAPSPGGAGAITCMRLALEDAGIDASDVVHINAHGTSTPLNDAAEAEAIATLFATPGPAVSSTKGVTGHPLGAAGALEAAAIVLSMQHGLIPPTDGTKAVDPALPPIDLVMHEPRPWTPGPSLSNSFGFGGHNGCLVLAPA